MTQIGVFIPIGSRGWFMSTTAPRTEPTFDLNKSIVQRAEHYGFDFALAMVKLRGFDGPSEYWIRNLEPFTLMAGIAATTQKIKLYASIALLTMPPAVAARMAVTIDSIAPRRFGVNIVTGWQPKEYQQMGLWPGEKHFANRYDFATEYVTVMRDLWETGVSDFKGEYFQMDDCKLSPRPSGKIDIVAANSSDRGMQFVAEHCDFNFVGAGQGINQPDLSGDSAARLMAAADKTGRDVGAYTLVTVISAPTDEMAFAKWDHYREGTDLEALAWAKGQSGQDTKATENSTASRMARNAEMQLKDPSKAIPNGGFKLIGSYENVARMLDQIAETPGIKGIMLIFDDFMVGIEAFGEHIQPLMTSRNPVLATAAE
ncbi:pyrimidine utilization protein A [Pseudooceanicola sp.]|uniref:pyrimidine utilization protein A n=1 Tax=Pseudooceanicola sp. TaxID=1914328 RepID=UPI00260EECFD|nr:pyrimidine utilization protein A [Pseudooceanicola sp.]MDF1857027.1 pyrimidine utilization protein A [Pseudooceanicola sp.]